MRSMRMGGRPRKAGSQAMVEFALVLPMFLIVLLGIMDGARMFFIYISLTNAAREAARQAIVSTDPLSQTQEDLDILTAFKGQAIIPGILDSQDKLCLYVSPPGQNNATPPTPCNSPWVTCTFPVSTSCNISAASRANSAGGFIEVYARHLFRYNAIFDAALERIGAFVGTDYTVELTARTRARLE